VDGRPQPGAGTMRVQVRDDRQVVLEARNAAGSVASTIGLLFLRPPEIRSFQASAGAVARGQPVTLTWDTIYATRVTLNGRPVEPGSGSLEVQPDQDTTYTLVAENELGRAERRAVVQVRAPAPTARR
jgi:ribosomal protein L24E